MDAPPQPRTPSLFGTLALVVVSVVVLVVAEMQFGTAPQLMVAVGVVWLVGFVGLLAWRRRTVSEGVGSFGQSLVAGVVLAILGVSLGAFADHRSTLRDLERRAREFRGLISSQERFSFRGESLAELDLRFLEMSTAQSAYDFSGADFSNSNLADVGLRNAILRRADLSGSNLSRADLTGADLRETDLHGAVLIDASLVGSNLAGANLGDHASLEGAVLGPTTVCPDNRPAYFDGQTGRFSCDDRGVGGEPPPVDVLAIVSPDASPGTLVARLRGAKEARYGFALSRDAETFSIDPDTGDITVAHQLEEDRYTLMVESYVRDQVVDTAILHISVEEPLTIYERPRLILVVQQAAAIGSKLGRIEPHVPEATQFELVSQPAGDPFSIDEDGWIRLAGRAQPRTTYTVLVEISRPSGAVTLASVDIEVVE